MGNFSNIFKQAYRLTKENNFLWIFGLLLTLNLAFGLIQSFMADPDRFLGARAVATIILLVISFRAQAGSIIAIKALLEKQETSFKKAWQYSSFFYMRLFYTEVLILLVLLIVAVVLSVPVSHFISLHQTTRAWTLGSLGGVIFLAILVPLSLVLKLAPLFIVIFDLKVRESMDKSMDLIQQFWPKLIGFGAILLVLDLLPVVFLSLLAYYNHGLAANIFGSAVVCLAYIFIYVFVQIAWVLMFNNLVKPQKFEEEVPVEVPEVIS